MKRYILHGILTTLVMLTALTGCEMMREDISDCPTGLYVNFVYDYNLQRADMFKEHVGCVVVYVYDEEGRVVARHAVSGDELTAYGYSVRFTEEELGLPDDSLEASRTFGVVALGLQRDWDEALETAGAKYRHSEPEAGYPIDLLTVGLDRVPTTGSRWNVVSTDAPLDTLWHTLQVMTAVDADIPTATVRQVSADGTVEGNGRQQFEVVKGEPTYVTASLMRQTKHLNITLHELDDPADVVDTDFEVFLIDDNGEMDWQNQILSATDSLVYRPYAHWTTTAENGGTIGTVRTAHYDMMFNRLRYNADDIDKNAVLCIRRIENGKDIAVINLPYMLAEACTAAELSRYQPQEYLDREYDYRLDFFIRGDRWVYVEVYVDVLNWSKRIQFVDF